MFRNENHTGRGSSHGARRATTIARRAPRRDGTALLVCVVAAATIAVATLAITRMVVSSAMLQSVHVGSDGRAGLWVIQERDRYPDLDPRLLQRIELRYTDRP